MADIDNDITVTNTAIRVAEDKIAENQAKVDKKDNLEKDKAKFEEQRKTLEKEKLDRTREFNDVKLQFDKAQRALEDAKAIRAGQEQDLVDGFKNVFGEATNELLNAQVIEATAKFNEELEALKQKATDENEKAIYTALQKRWTREIPRKRWGKTEITRPINIAQVNVDFNTLMSSGPEAMMQELLISQINPDTGVNYSPTEAAAVLADKAFVGKMQPEAVKQLLAQKHMAGGLTS